MTSVSVSLRRAASRVRTAATKRWLKDFPEKSTKGVAAQFLKPDRRWCADCGRNWLLTVASSFSEQAEFAVVMRTTADPSALSTAAARVVRELDPLQPVFDVQTMRDRLEGSQQLTYERFRTAIMIGFGLAALLLAGLGIYGVVRYSVTQRTQEFGIRLALGASPPQICGMVLRHSLRATAVGGAVGVLGSIAVGRLLASVLYGGVSTQPIIMIAVAVLLAGLSAIAAIGPARRASRVDPLIALRSE